MSIEGISPIYLSTNQSFDMILVEENYGSSGHRRRKLRTSSKEFLHILYRDIVVDTCGTRHAHSATLVALATHTRETISKSYRLRYRSVTTSMIDHKFRDFLNFMEIFV